MSTKTLTKGDKARLAKAQAKRERRKARNLALAGGVQSVSIAFSDKMTVKELYALAQNLPGVTTKTRKADLLAALGGAK